MIESLFTSPLRCHVTYLIRRGEGETYQYHRMKQALFHRCMNLLASSLHAADINVSGLTIPSMFAPPIAGPSFSRIVILNIEIMGFNAPEKLNPFLRNLLILTPALTHLALYIDSPHTMDIAPLSALRSLVHLIISDQCGISQKINSSLPVLAQLNLLTQRFQHLSTLVYKIERGFKQRKLLEELIWHKEWKTISLPQIQQSFSLELFTVDEEHLTPILQATPNLTQLEFNVLTRGALFTLAQFKKLASLTIGNRPMLEDLTEGPMPLSDVCYALSQCHALTHLGIVSWLIDVKEGSGSRKGWDFIFAGAPSLTSLFVSNSHDPLQFLVPHAARIHRLSLDSLSLHETSLEAIVRDFTNLEHLQFSHIELIVPSGGPTNTSQNPRKQETLIPQSTTLDMLLDAFSSLNVLPQLAFFHVEDASRRYLKWDSRAKTREEQLTISAWIKKERTDGFRNTYHQQRNLLQVSKPGESADDFYNSVKSLKIFALYVQLVPSIAIACARRIIALLHIPFIRIQRKLSN